MCVVGSYVADVDVRVRAEVRVCAVAAVGLRAAQVCGEVVGVLLREATVAASLRVWGCISWPHIRCF